MEYKWSVIKYTYQKSKYNDELKKENIFVE